MITDRNPMTIDQDNQQSSPPPVPLILVRRFKSLMRTSVQRRHRRSDYFMSMSDNCACIPPGTPLSSKTYRTSTTVESNGTVSPDRDVHAEDESVTSRVEKATTTESVSDAGACGTTASWSFLSLPTIQKTSNCVQFAPSQDRSTDDELLLDILIGANQELVETAFLDEQMNKDNHSCHDKENNNQSRQRLVMRPLPIENDVPDQHFHGSTHHIGPTDVTENNKVIEQTVIVNDTGLNASVTPQVPTVGNPIYPTTSMILTDQELQPMFVDPNIPREIFCYQDQYETDEEEGDDMYIVTNEDENYSLVHAKVAKSEAPVSSRCLLPCPKDIPLRRRARPQHHPQNLKDFDRNVVNTTEDTATTEDLSLIDIICRHQHTNHEDGDAVLHPEEGDDHLIPMLVIEVDHRQGPIELPPPRHRHRRRRRRRQSSSGVRTPSYDDDVKEQHSNSRHRRKGYPPLSNGPLQYHAPEYASV